MKVKFLRTTNSAFNELIGKEMELSIDMIASYTFNSDDCSFDFRHGRGRTSKIKSIIYDEISFGCTNIIIETNNSTYTFQHGEPSDKKPLSKEESLNLAIAAGMHLI
jgi:hypothetical protein